MQVFTATVYRYLFLLFFLVPLLEVWILVRVGSLIGAPLLIASIIVTAALGVFFLRTQGLATLFRAQTALAGGELPTVEILEGALLLVAGALLLTPGFATDGIGFTLLWPSARRAIAQLSLARYGLGPAAGGTGAGSGSPQQDGELHSRRHTAASAQAGPKQGAGEVIEGEYTRED